jgi:hypothetical protein
MCNQCTGPSRVLIGELEDLINGSVGAATTVQMVNPKRVACRNFGKQLLQFLPKGATDPVAALEMIVQHAVEMLTDTIDELNRIQQAVASRPPDQARDQIGWPLVGDRFGQSLAQRMNIKVEDPNSWRGDGPGKVGLVKRWLTNIRDMFGKGGLMYTCIDTSADCTDTVWAWVPTAAHPDVIAKGKSELFHIHLCTHFWVPRKAQPPRFPAVTPTEHFEYQARVLIHEGSHIYYNTADKRGTGPGVAECISQFVAETNNSPVDPKFVKRCGGPLK